MLRYLLLIAAFAGLVWVFSLGLQRDPSELPSPFIGEPAPALDLPSLTDPDDRLSRDTLTRGMSLVNVWATWCVGCRQEHEFLMQLADSGEIAQPISSQGDAHAMIIYRPELALGTFVGGGVTYTLPRRVGWARANDTSSKWPAQMARWCKRPTRWRGAPNCRLPPPR